MVVTKEILMFCSQKMPISIQYLSRLAVRCRFYRGITSYNVTKLKEIAPDCQGLKKSTFCRDDALQSTHEYTAGSLCNIAYLRHKFTSSSVCASTLRPDERRFKIISADRDGLALSGLNTNVISSNQNLHQSNFKDKVMDVREHCWKVFGQHVRRYSTMSLCSGSISCNGVASSLFQSDALLNVDAPRRYKARSRQGKMKKGDKDQQEEDEDTDEEDEDEDEDSDIEADDEYLPEDKKFSAKFKDLTTYIKSLRVDAVVGAGLNISRSKIEDQFLGSKLRLNGEKLLKKGVKMEPGDIADLVMSHVDGKMDVKRVRVVSVDDGKTRKDRIKVKLRAWRGAVTIEEL